MFSCTCAPDTRGHLLLSLRVMPCSGMVALILYQQGKDKKIYHFKQLLKSHTLKHKTYILGQLFNTCKARITIGNKFHLKLLYTQSTKLFIPK